MNLETCRHCTTYTAYYQRLGSSFHKMDRGYCSFFKTDKICKETCDYFVSSDKKEISREKRLFNSLEESLQSINEIVQILREKEKDKQDFLNL